MSDLIVVTGPPGAGKSIVARSLASMFDPSALVAGDHFFGFIDRGYIPPWTADAHRQNEIVVGAAAASVGRLVVGGYTVVYDGVLGPWFLDAFLAATGLNALHYVLLLPPEQDAIERVGSRVGHGFTDLDAARRMYREFADADIHPGHVITSTETPGTIASSIVQLMGEGLLTRATPGPSAHPS